MQNYFYKYQLESDIIKEYLNTSSNKYEKHGNKNINKKTNEIFDENKKCDTNIKKENNQSNNEKDLDIKNKVNNVEINKNLDNTNKKIVLIEPKNND